LAIPGYGVLEMCFTPGTGWIACINADSVTGFGGCSDPVTTPYGDSTPTCAEGCGYLIPDGGINCVSGTALTGAFAIPGRGVCAGFFATVTI
jgi:hypothetical protein